MEPKKYYLGLDVGTNSVGFCVTDENYNIIKKHKVVTDGKTTKYYGNHLWGARLFDDANTTARRRNNRESRRRLQRRRWRILLLQDCFKTEMDKVDSTFFDRLNNSAIHNEDKEPELRSKYLLFNGFYNDKLYKKEYPTIYHVRLDMICHPEKKFDIRLVYLVLAHMIKYRGNFLYEGEFTSVNSDVSGLKEKFERLNESLANLVEEDEDVEERFDVDDEKINDLIEAFKDKTKIGELYDAQVAALKLTGIKSTEIRALILKIIAGGTVDVKKFFKLEDSEIKEKIDFSNDKFIEEILPAISSEIGEDATNILLISKEIYDYRILVNLLKGKNYVSEAMVDLYNKHQSQLKELKYLIKKYNPEKYNYFFKTSGKGKNTYANYVGFNWTSGKKGKEKAVSHSTDLDSLYKEIKNILPQIENCEKPGCDIDEEDRNKLKEIKYCIESKQYLLRQNSKENGVLPYQLNLIEMRKIIENQSVYYPFLNDMASDFNDASKECYKIESILKFKIPYYVGPLSSKATYQWIAKNEENTKITPWNFHSVVNEDKSAENFMENLKNYCTYLIKEPTLPKNSLLYTKFVLLNEINKFIVEKVPISYEDKMYLIDNVYLHKSKVSLKDLKNALKAKYHKDVEIESAGTSEGKGITDLDLNASLKPWIELSNENAFGKKLLTDEKTYELAEKIIYDISTFEDKKLVQKRLKVYGLTPSQIKYISSLKYTGWAKLSKKLLDGLTTPYVLEDTGEEISVTIIDLMMRTNLNFMEIYEGKDYGFTFKEQVEKLNGEINLTAEELIDEEYASPMMKRALRQTIKIVEELKKVLKIDHFDAYYVESTRSKQDSIRTLSRKRQIQNEYAEATVAVKKLEKERVEEVKKSLANLKTKIDEIPNDDKLKNKRLYLYFMQLGRSVYTGEEISLDDLSKEYDIDHIIPQSLIKDDSFINTVLVERCVNNRKGATYPITKEILTEKGRQWVKILEELGLMPKEKKDRILRSINKPLTDEELSGFVQRQLVSTSQSIKAICDILKKIDSKADIVFSKAGLVSDFRKVFDFKKVREVNDFHHAHDAYLNVVVGNVFKKVFSSGNPKTIQYRREHMESFHMDVEYLFQHDQRMIYTDSLVWKAKRYDENGVEDNDSKGTIDVVRKYMSYNDPLVTKMTVSRNGLFTKVSLHSSVEGNAGLPLKCSGPFSKDGYQTKYGGYSDLANPYVMLVESEVKGKKKYSIEFVPNVKLKLVGKNEEKIKEILIKDNGLKNPKIIINKLLFNSIIQIPYYGKLTKLCITGKSDNRILCINMSELHIEKKYSDIFYKIIKILGNEDSIDKESMEDVHSKGYVVTREETKELFEYFVNDLYCRPQYKGLPEIGSQFAKIIDLKSRFDVYSTFLQMKLLFNMLKLTNCKSVKGTKMSDFSTELPSDCGTIRLNKNLLPGTKIIQTSITGLYETVLFTVPEE